MIVVAARLSRIIFTAIFALPISLPSQADPRMTPTTSYRAELVMKAQGMPDIAAPIAYSGGQLRFETSKGGEAVWFLFRRGSREATAVRTGRREFQTIILPDGYDPFSLLGAAAHDAARAGEEIVAGQQTSKWNVTGALLQGGTISGSVWTTRENIQVRAEGETVQDETRIRFAGELRNLRIGAVDPTLFQVPAGFTRKVSAAPPREDATGAPRPSP